MNPSLPADYHTHNRLCRHAGGDPIDYVRAAIERGISEIACTDHIPFPNDPTPSIRMTREDFDLYVGNVRAAQAAGGCTVLLGIEADYQRDLVSAHIQSVLDLADFDLVLGSLHTGPFWDLAPGDPAATPEFVEQMNRTYYLRMAELADTRLYDVCSHFDIVKRTGIRAPEALLAEIVPPALDAVAAAGMSVEINTSGLNHGAAEFYPAPRILAWMHERGIPITFGSDSHNPGQIGQHFEQAVALARAAGYTHRAQYRRRKMTLVPF
ncbi:MAG: histidinol-phosphatase HisJ family protein [Kiritimatiellae bacterium]|jgi:histidinol-phosphatase (PHP family)|nr:histidinol-phosphatase HisJ family protein [Kiritimatiellia bacterium]HPC18977.1 histidinol-phosphatase HisJ family protein [Kiritimatiellia bacterium]HQQ61925.1 histidinol-phosphatase HisJ family protein [Kiritimatiellia bacterium]